MILPPMTGEQVLATLRLLAEQHPDPVIARQCGELLAERGGDLGAGSGCEHGFVPSSCSQCRAGLAGQDRGVIYRARHAADCPGCAEAAGRALAAGHDPDCPGCRAA